MPNILFTNYYKGTALELIRRLLPDGFSPIFIAKACREEIIAKAPCADYMVVGGRIPIDIDIINAASRLKMIQRTGVGTDVFDFALLKSRNIPVYVNPGVNARSVAEHAVMLMLATLRRLPVADANTKKGIWLKHELGLSTFELSGKSIGLVGLGHIGGHVARILQGFDARVSYHDAVRASVEKEHAWGVRYVELSELLQASDIISIHCPLNDRTRGMFGASQFAAMKPGAIVINTSRGPVIDECALAESLKSGHLMGAGLDVFAHEPLSLDSPLTQLDNVVLTPHVAGVTYDAFGRMMREAFGNIVHYEAGRYAEIEERKLNY